MVLTITLNSIKQILFNQTKSYDKQFQMPVRLLSFVNELPTENHYNKIQDWNKNKKTNKILNENSSANE